MAGYFSISDIYRDVPIVNTAEATIPTEQEQQYINTATVETAQGTQVNNPQYVLGAVILFVAVVTLLHFIK